MSIRTAHSLDVNLFIRLTGYYFLVSDENVYDVLKFFSYCKVTHYIYREEKYMLKRTNNRVQSITQNVDKVKDRKTKKRGLHHCNPP